MKARGTGRLVTWAVVHSPPHSAFADEVPYTTGYVELTEGPWLPARIIAAGSAALQQGAPMRVAFVHPSDGESYPVFTMETPGTADCEERSDLRATQSSPAPDYGVVSG